MEAWNLHTSRLFRLLIIASFLSAGILFLFISAFRLDGGLSLPVFLFGIALFGSPWLVFALTKRRAWKNISKRVRTEHVRQISPSGIRVEVGDESAEFRWSDYAGYRMTDSLVLLYPSPSVFVLIPRHHFSNDDDWNAFRELVRANIPSAENGGT